MQRVMIIGQPGSGKPTLAREMGGITHLPVVHKEVTRFLRGLRKAAASGNLGISHR